MMTRRYNDPAAHNQAVQAARLRHRYGTSDAREAFSAAVATRMVRGNITRYQAILAVGRDDPELWAAYRMWKPAPEPTPAQPRPTAAQQRAMALKDQWEAAISERMRRRGLLRSDAIMAVSRELPDLRDAYNDAARAVAREAAR